MREQTRAVRSEEKGGLQDVSCKVVISKKEVGKESW